MEVRIIKYSKIKKGHCKNNNTSDKQYKKMTDYKVVNNWMITWEDE